MKLNARHSVLLLLIACAMLAGVVTIWRREQRSRPTAPTSDQAPAPTENREPAVDELVAASPSVQGSDTSKESARSATPSTETATTAAWGTLQDTNGAAIADAEVTWTSIVPIRAIAVVDAHPVHTQSNSDSTLTTRSRTDGTFSFSAPPSNDDRATVVWITKPSFAAHALELAAPSNWPRGETVVLTAALPITVSVVDSSSVPIAGANVTQRVFGSWPRGNVTQPEISLGALFAYERVATTDTTGRVMLSPLGTDEAIDAALGAQRSRPWRGRPAEGVQLMLNASFNVIGTVRSLNGAEAERGVFVTCMALDGHLRRDIVTTEVNRNGGWQMELPLCTSDGFVFRLHGGDLLPDEKRVPSPGPGETIQVEFEAVTGVPVQVRVEDTSALPLSSAFARVTWTRDGVERSNEAATDATGVAHLRCQPNVLCWGWGRKQGWIERSSDTQTYVTTELREPIVVPLLRGGSVKGRCASRDGPVEEFEILYYVTSDMSQRRTFSNAPNGEFVLDELPNGPVSLIASSPVLGQSNPVKVDVAPDSTAEVVLELLDLIVARGRVVDARSGAPFSGALVQPWTLGNAALIAPRGSAIPVLPDGTFEALAFVAGTNRIEVSAPGCATKQVAGFGKVGETLDFGLVALERTQQLTVELVSDGTLPLRDLWVTGSGRGSLPLTMCDEQGRVVFDDVAPGQWQIDVRFRDGHEESISTELMTGRPWTVRVPVSAQGKLTVECKGERANDIVCLDLFAKLADGTIRVCRGFTSDRVAQLSTFGARDAVLSVSEEYEVVAMRQVDETQLKSGKVVIELGGDNVRFRLVDRKREPVSGGSLIIRLAGNSGAFARTLPTDADGLASLRDWGDGAALDVLAFHPSIGVAPSRSIDVSRRDEVHELVLDPLGPLEIRVLDRDVPLGAVEVRVTDPIYHANRVTTDATGRARTYPLCAGRYKVAVLQSGYWPTSVELEIAQAPEPMTLQVRRLGSVAFEIAGASVAGLPVRLRSREFAVDVAEWLAAGSVRASSASLLLDGAGKLTVDDLPNGEYEWCVDGSTGVLASGVVTVPPRAVATVEAVLP